MTSTDPQHVLSAYQAAVFARDVDALLALYAEEVCVFDVWGVWAYDGATAWRTAVEEWFGSLGDEQVQVSFSEVQVRAGDNLSTLHAVVTYQGQSARGEVLRAMQNRLTWVLERRLGGWKIIHEHTSAPANPETLKVMLAKA
ncbi:DUF4440 domain-containing protein (plasmid) [Deinococcus psychrotolerans]|uniref:DUF4440 domain-containing protein n=1 Tax=Deinococcus psychrotolerans TaxID=2489213 RepID=A0A3G8YHG7_9DEIO|nr:nuclear transport factor 2 family protein [Deinococcus psychrotolerans]AZI44728.1 DUF4440 domain-containing protein [Deinococcus psychrotolerans]